MPALAYVAVGSNLGDRQAMLARAQARLETHPRISVRRVSSIYETDPVGFLAQGRFLNAVWELETELAPDVLLGALLSVEKDLGRERNVKNGPRVIDLDLLAYDDFISDRPKLILPHPRLHERYFVLKPLSELNPEWVHPHLHRTVQELLSEVSCH